MHLDHTPSESDIQSPSQILRCVSWAAVSSEKQATEDKESLPEQKRLNREFIENLHQHYAGYAGELIDELVVVGSRSIVLLQDAVGAYPAYAKLFDYIRQQAIDAIVLRSLDRLGRNAALSTTIVELAREKDIAVIPRLGNRPQLDSDASMANVLMSGIEGALAQAEIHTLQQRLRTGMIGRVKRRQLFPNRCPFGYRYVYRFEGDRKPARIELYPEQAETVRMILIDLYTDRGLGAPSIADWLNKRGVPTPSFYDEGRGWKTADRWHDYSVYAIIRRARIYTGKLTLYAHSGAPYIDPRTGLRRTPRRQERRDFDGQHPAIITPAEYDALMAVERSRRTTRRTRLFSGSAICGVCGTVMHGKKFTGPKVPGKVVNGMTCPNGCTNIYDRLLMDALQDALTALENAAEDANLVPDNSGRLVEIRQVEQIIQKQVDHLEQNRKHAVRQLVAQRITETEFDQEAARIDAQRRNLEQQLADLEVQRRQAEDVERRHERVAEVRKAARTLLSRADDYPELVQGWLREHVRLYVDKGRGAGRVRVEFI